MSIQKQHVEYIAKLMRSYRAETGNAWPEDVAICTNWYSAIAEFDEILGLPVLKTDVPTSEEFWFCTKAINRPFSRWLREAMEVTPFRGETK